MTQAILKLYILLVPEELVDEGQLQEEQGGSKSRTGAYILV
ncbi:hypothetical protein [Candidatus Tisiphia endosymbiont of Beris chalybata]